MKDEELGKSSQKIRRRLQLLTKATLFLLIFSIFSIPAIADDAVYEGDGIDVYPLSNGDIQLVSEVITISPGPGWNVHVDMTFKNHGQDTTVQMGFPVFSSYSPDDGKTEDHDFQTWVNGEKVVIAKKHGVPNPVQGLQGFPETVFVHSVNFKSGETKKIVHSYSVGGYSNANGDWEFKYILRTGALWKGKIENLKIIYETGASWAQSLPCVTPAEHESDLNGGSLILKWEYNNYEPNVDLSITGNRLPIPEDANLMTSHKRGMAMLSSCSIRNLKNSIFASYGYPFKKSFVRAQFYYSGSPYKENPGFDMNKMRSEDRSAIDYLSNIERWRSELEKKRNQGILDYENKIDGRQYSFETGFLNLLGIDRNKNIAIAEDSGNTLLISYPDCIPQKQLILPQQQDYRSNEVGGEGYTRAIKSSNNKYLAIPIHNKASSENQNYEILILNAENKALLQPITVTDLEFSHQAQFSMDSTMLFTSDGAYDVVAGKKIRRWIYPETIQGERRRFFQVFSGTRYDGNLIFGLSGPYANEKTKIYVLDVNKGEFNVLKEFDGSDVILEAHSISPDGNYLAGFVTKVKMGKTGWEVAGRKLIIWKFMENSLAQIYEAAGDKILPFVVWAGQKGNHLFQIDFKFKLWRYDIQPGKEIKPTNIPIEGYLGRLNDVTLNPFFIGTYGRKWDIETGKKIWPWYEALDPFDKSNLLPLYDANPMPISLRDYWGDN